MGILDIGTENLPNVFIENIIIRELDNGDRNIEVTCLIKDHKGRQSDKSWFGREELSNMNVKLLLVHDLDQNFNAINNSLTRGTRSLQDFKAVDGDSFFMQFEAANNFTLQESDPLDDDNYYNTFVFLGIPPQVNNIVLFAATFIETFGFENDLFNRFYGPVAGELVLLDGEVNTKAHYFYDPETDLEYGGPVHFHASGYMQGSQHREEAHISLRLVTEDNAKISVEKAGNIESILEELSDLPIVTQTIERAEAQEEFREAERTRDSVPSERQTQPQSAFERLQGTQTTRGVTTRATRDSARNRTIGPSIAGPTRGGY